MKTPGISSQGNTRATNPRLSSPSTPGGLKKRGPEFLYGTQDGLRILSTSTVKTRNVWTSLTGVILAYVHVQSLQSCPALCSPMD